MADIDVFNGGYPLRKRAVRVHPWLLLDSAAQSQILEAGKHAIMRRTGLTGRDLRRLDPLLQYPSCTIMGRERAIIFSVEHVKAIIMAHELLLLNSKDPAVAPFVEELRKKILNHRRGTDGPSSDQEAGDPESSDDGRKLDPFEFVALEACFEFACTSLDNEATTLVEEAYPALDELTSKICTLNLERVQQIKTRLIEITKRVEMVRYELEHLLDDNEAMSKMYLQNKHLQQHENESENENEKNSHVDEVAQEMKDEDFRTPAEFLTETSGGSTRYGSDLGNRVDRHQEELYDGNKSEFGRYSQASYASTAKLSTRSDKKLDVKDLEKFLETYFVQIDATLNGLSELRDYVDDTEDYINIMLDDKRNDLTQWLIKLMTGSIAFTCFMILDACMAINIQIDLFNKTATPNKNFYWFIIMGVFGSFCIYVAFSCLYRYKGWLR